MEKKNVTLDHRDRAVLVIMRQETANGPIAIDQSAGWRDFESIAKSFAFSRIFFIRETKRYALSLFNPQSIGIWR